MRVTTLGIFSMITALFVVSKGFSQQHPEGFAVVDSVLSGVVLELRYASTDNFTGRVIKGYESPKKVLSVAALEALKGVQDSLMRLGLGLKIFDGYRPQRAVNYFMAWAQLPADTLAKAAYYPDVSKDSLFAKGYIAERSGHSRGSTIDLTLIYLKGPLAGQEVDMGGSYDFFGPQSATDYDQISEDQRFNRRLLLEVMTHFGFVNYTKEWWHFTLKKEPFAHTYFDF
ncbi:MAG: M15 family metallopeptidase [Flavobacteriaceae bacterium]